MLILININIKTMKTHIINYTKKSYYYLINGIVRFTTLKEVNSFLKRFHYPPAVQKFETWNNGKTSKINIKVKGSLFNYTIS